MRMWMVDPQCLCRRHLLGEHLECGHMLPGAIRTKKTGSLIGLARDGFIQVGMIHDRHAALAEEMTRRGYAHRSPLPEIVTSNIPEEVAKAVVDVQKSLDDLVKRCGDCRQRIQSKQQG